MSYFSYVGKLFSNVKGFYNEINAATLTGAIDAIIIEQNDGSYRSSPFHIRFGKLGVLRSKEKVVDIEINGEPVDIQMKLGDSGEAFFVHQVEDESEDIPIDLATSPLIYDSDLMERGLQELHKEAEAAEAKVTEDFQGSGVKDMDNIEVKDTDNVKVKDTQSDVVIQISDKIESVKGSMSEPKASDIKLHEHIEAVKSDSAIKSEGSSERETELRVLSETNDTFKTRKKRRRKKKNMPSGMSKLKPDSANGHTGDTEDGDIFEMEDLSSDEEMSRLTSGMSTSISLPVVEESKLERTNEWATAHEGFYLNQHPFSDTDLSPLGSPISTRPHTPKSDTEVDRQKSIESQEALHFGEEETTLWEWGDLPRKSITDDSLTVQVRHTSPEGITDDEKAAASGGLFQFMRKTKNMRHKPEEEGIYLDDLNIEDMDSETAKLYFPKRFSNTRFRSIEEKEDDVESGRGASLPQSPHSVEGAIGGPSSTLLPSEVKHLGAYSLSLCGGLSDPDGVTLEKFMSKIVTYDDLKENPNMLTNPELVVRVGHKYYNWLTAAPIIISQIAFQKSLPETTVDSLCSQHMPKKKEKKESYSSWFSWRRKPHDGTTPTPTAPTGMSESEMATSKSGETSPHDSTQDSHPSSNPPSLTASPQKIKPIDRLKVVDHSSSEADTDSSDRGNVPSRAKRKIKKEIFKKSLRLSSDQIKQLKLQPGQNEVTYSVTTQFQGTKRCTSHIYLWKHNDKIIVSDIDGTITKSDVLGQILPIMGRDWSQSGVAQLYSSICRNGYKFLYLSARAIGQSKLTKDLLRNINQGDMTLPEGPLLLSPTSLISAFHREVIEKKPEEFKISCLKDIGALFPQNNTPFYAGFGNKVNNNTPFYAGFGNKVNDVYAYKAINIPIFRIFTINPHGELKHELSYTFQSSYTKMMDVADHFFPPVHKLQQKHSSEYSQVEYWRDPLPEISPIEVQQVMDGTTSTSLPEKQSS